MGNQIQTATRYLRTQAQLVNYRRRRAVARLDDPDVRALRRAVRALRAGLPDVLYLGDSAVSLISPTDRDRRSLLEMVQAGLGEESSVYGLHGAGYNPAMFTQYLRPFAALPAPPAVIVSLCARLGTVPWYCHPYFARTRPTEFMGRVSLAHPRRIRATFPRPRGIDYEQHMAREHHTWAGELTVGDYIRPLKNRAASGLSADEAGRLLYAYHHGGVVEPGYLDTIEVLGRTLRALDTPVVAYHTPVPVERGVDYFGEPFRELAVSNFAAMDAAFRRGLGEDSVVIQTGLICHTDQFLDPTDGSEHLSQSGRAQVAQMIVDGMRAATAPADAIPGPGVVQTPNLARHRAPGARSSRRSATCRAAGSAEKRASGA